MWGSKLDFRVGEGFKSILDVSKMNIKDIIRPNGSHLAFLKK